MDTRNFINSIDRVINDLYETPLDAIKDFREKMPKNLNGKVINSCN